MRFITILAFLIAVSACQQIGFQKRKHLKGYYFSHAPRLQKDDKEAGFDLPIADSIRRNNTITERKLSAKTDEKNLSASTSDNLENENSNNNVNSFSSVKKSVEINRVIEAGKTAKHESNIKGIKSNGKNNAKSSQERTNEFIGWYGLAGLSLIGFTHFRRNKKSRFTAWARDNRKKGIAIIIAALGINYLTSIFLGKNLADFGFTSSIFTRDVLWVMTGISLFAFPTNRRIINNYKNRTRAFVVLFALISALGINSGVRMQNQSELSYTEQQLSTYVTYDHKLEHASPFSGQELAWRILTTVFLVLFNIGLGFLLTFLICNLMCSGLGVAAVLIGVFGFGAIIVGMIFTLRAIWKRPSNGMDQSDPNKKNDPNYDPDENYFTKPADQ